MILAFLPPSPGWVGIQLAPFLALSSMTLLEPEEAVVLGNTGLGVQKRKPQLPFRHHPGVEIGSIFQGFLVELLNIRAEIKYKKKKINSGILMHRSRSIESRVNANVY